MKRKEKKNKKHPHYNNNNNKKREIIFEENKAKSRKSFCEAQQLSATKETEDKNVLFTVRKKNKETIHFINYTK